MSLIFVLIARRMRQLLLLVLMFAGVPLSFAVNGSDAYALGGQRGPALEHLRKAVALDPIDMRMAGALMRLERE